MIDASEDVNGLVALMAILGGHDGDWALIEKAGELYVVPAGHQDAPQAR